MILILGGARSGKSSFAEQKAKVLQEQLSTEVLYIATAIAFDKDMKNRIKKHQDARPNSWHTLEQYKAFEELAELQDFKKSQVILLDCMTLMVSNLLLDEPVDFDKISWEEIDCIEERITTQVKTLLKICKKCDKQLIIVANEVGLGIVPAYRLGSIFRDIAGRMNQFIAREADEVYLLTAGIPIALK